MDVNINKSFSMSSVCFEAGKASILNEGEMRVGSENVQ